VKLNMANKKMYTPEGWPNVDYIVGLPGNLFLIWGGRGCGKTFSFLKYFLEHGEKILYVRTTPKEMKQATSPALQPYGPLNREEGLEIHPLHQKGTAETYFYSCDVGENGKLIPTGSPVAQILSLQEGGRGIDGSQYNTIVWDEFIPDIYTRKKKGTFEAFMNLWESVNRNREFSGGKPVKIYCLSNSTTINSDVFIGLNVVKYAYKLNMQGGGMVYLPERGIRIICMSDSPISAKKAQTSQYKAVGEDSDFYRMSISNTFVGEEEHVEKSMNLKEFTPTCFVGEIYIYKHKSTGRFYVSEHKTGTAPQEFGTGTTELERFKTKFFAILWRAYMLGSIDFESRLCELLFVKYFGK